MYKNFDMVVVGAGPGGLSAAVTANAAGMSVLVLNEQDHAGGQIYHSLENVRKENKDTLGEDYLHGQNLISNFRNSDVEYIANATVLNINSGESICYVKDEKIFLIKTKHIIIAAGAMERPVSIPGWTLPGVMGAASIDILFKQSDIIPSGEVIFAGSGPLLFLVANHLIDNGVKISAILDTSKFANYIKAMPHIFGAFKKFDYLIKGMKMLGKIRKAGIPFIKGITDIEAIGNDHITSVKYKRNGKSYEIATDLLLLHEGVIPNTQLSRVTGCEHEWYKQHRYWKPVIDEWGQSSVKGITLVGDCTGIFGAKVAEYSGYIAGLNLAFLSGFISKSKRDKDAEPYMGNKKKEMTIRPFIDSIYRPNKELLVPKKPETTICRCEEVTLEDIQIAMDKGYTLPLTVKNKTRSGMGRCQGRMCGLVLSEIIADKHGISPEEIGYYNIRPFIKPVTLDQIGNMKMSKDQF